MCHLDQLYIKHWFLGLVIHSIFHIGSNAVLVRNLLSIQYNLDLNEQSRHLNCCCYPEDFLHLKPIENSIESITNFG